MGGFFMRYFVVVPIYPRSKEQIVLESLPTRRAAMASAKRRRDAASPGSIHRLCRVQAE